jgi:Carboxypeptidase regulatory-like domain/Polysaccharide lyase family 4, domain II
MNRKLVGVVGLALVVVGAYLLFFRHHAGSAKPPAKPPSKATQYSVSSKAPDTKLGQIDLDREGPLRLEGQVIDGDGHGVGGAEVWVGTVPPRMAKSEEDGSFSFDKLVGRAYRLTARSGNEVGGPIEYRLTDKSDPAILQLVAGAKLIVSVHGDDKKPIAGAEVKADEDHGVTVTTGDDGTATLSPVSPGWVSVHAAAEGFAPNRGFTSVGSANATGRIDITLHAGVIVTGHVVDEVGKAIAQAQVSTAGIWNLGSSVEPVTSDDKGAFTLTLAAGTHTLVAVDKEHAPSRSTPVVVGTKPVDGLVIVMKVGGRLAGKVVDPKHLPIAFATVRVAGKGSEMYGVSRRQATTDKDGVFELRGLSRAKLDVRAETDTAGSKIVSFDLTTINEKKDVELVLDVTGTISGVVVDDKAQPIAEVQVASTPDVFGGANEDSLALTGFSTATTDGDGKFTIHGLPDGPYKLHASRHETQRFNLEGTAAKTGDTNVKLVLATPGSITGTLAKSDGKPPILASVRAGWRPGTPATDGKFLVDDLEPGDYDLTIHGPEFADIIKHGVKVEVGKTTDLGAITVPHGRTLTGKVVDASGAPVPGAKIKAGNMLYQIQGAEDQMSTFEDASGTRSAYSDQDGAFVLIGIPKQATNVMAESDKGRSNAIEVPGGEDDPPAIALQLKGFGTIVGKVTLKGQPAPSIAVTDTPKAGGAQIQISQADDTGAFTITKVAEGTHVLSAMQQGGMGASFKTSSTTVQITAGQTTTVTLDIPVGTITLDVDIKPAAGATVNAAQVFLFHGTVALTSAKDIQTAFLGGTAAGMKFWFGTTAEFTELVPGDYSACSLPITGSMSDSTFLQRIQENLDVLKVYCQQLKILVAPEKQSLTQTLPSMTPLPPPKS